MATVKDVLYQEAGLLELNETVSYAEPPWMPFLRSVFYYASLVATGGILVNFFVLLKLWEIMRRHPMLNPAVSLFAMTASDAVCQMSLILYNTTAHIIFLSPSVPVVAKQAFCKAIITAIHTTNSFSTWCWVVLSCLRFIAICAPLLYNSHPSCHRPTAILTVIFMICLLVESWMPVFITFDSDHAFDCAPHNFENGSILRTFYSLEVSWTCFVPVVITVALDLGLVLRRPGLLIKANQRTKFNSSEVCLNPVSEISSARQRRGQRMLRRYLFLATLDLMMNVPHSLSRFMAMHIQFELGVGIELFTMLGYLLYYGQFNINILYLWALCKPSEETRRRNDTPSTQETGALRDPFIFSSTDSPEPDDIQMKRMLRPRASTYAC